ncbi:MAG: MBL fold metallo-hydrolase [Methanomassiliicoccales archaeon]|nr:MBL fold metallo-hydrolase [Methanomassiliicoccales archaeon]
MTTITFLGTSGGRFATIYQARSTGGIYISDSARIHLDPGPGALVAMKKMSIDPARTDAILISHCHPDHYTDAEILIEGMTCGGFGRRGIVIGSKSVIDGKDAFGPAISRYHRSLPENVLSLKPGDKTSVDGILIEATPTIHSDPTGIGFRFHTSNGIISYVGDSEVGEEVIKAHRSSRVIILCVTRPLGSRISYHMNTDDAAEFARSVCPEIVLLTHFGMKLLSEGAEKQAKYIEKESGIETIAMTDFASVHIGDEIHINRKRRRN